MEGPGFFPAASLAGVTGDDGLPDGDSTLMQWGAARAPGVLREPLPPAAPTAVGERAPDRAQFPVLDARNRHRAALPDGETAT